MAEPPDEVANFLAEYADVIALLDAEPPLDLGNDNNYNNNNNPPSGSGSDSDFEVLEEAPPHLRRANPPASPIMVLSDDEDGEEGNDLQPRAHKRAARGSIELLDEPPKSKQRVDDLEQPLAGPSKVSDFDAIVTDVKYLIPVVLEVIPDLCTAWVRENLEHQIESLKDHMVTPGQEAVDRVINAALEMDQYPREGDATKAQQKEDDEGDYKDRNYRAELRKGINYQQRAFAILEDVHNTVPIQFIRAAWKEQGGMQLVPTYIFLHGLATTPNKPYRELKRARTGKGRMNIPILDGDQAEGCQEFHREYRFLKQLMAEAVEREQRELANTAAKRKQEADREERRQRAITAGQSRECGCCFDQEALEDLVACPEGHMFCRTCVASLAENKLGEHQIDIICMDMSQCDAPFSDAVLAAVCGEQTMSLYHRLRQMKDLEMAAIDGLESCPHCPFAMVIDNPDEKLFRCHNPACSKVTCRNCKRPDHIPKRCEEMEQEFKLDKRHAVEEAMSAALMRRCPKCSKAYLKESGCNKITVSRLSLH
ncbi:hypothetical protein CC85DRAFT_183013 [Cutaneotrichosporon oleaginosum]|uniref:RING-type domain-containing protein n=1 Tax=Cutaneotrichosporon oleaginosum TaxID=879819 RepID=A0A0J0XF29_9TREE|nr:uncharacterized protein CC85DRAFT_183013 [Cutaneotrichosporon oleaginosum]KLT39658.1 hypothetical protein CC85DRAFT_183013 [Cutaneotrichosporon oleaginosum]TXT07035.1 hypothetical protein COLE_06366 [Cutaneotrichosporon oleaginosum]